MPVNQTLEGFGNITRRQCFNVTITDDDVREDAETFTVTLEKPFNGSLPKILIRPAMVTVTILDNDGKDMHTIIIRVLCMIQFNVRNSISGIYH